MLVDIVAIQLRNVFLIRDNGKRYFSSPALPNWLWGQTSLLFKEYPTT